MVLRELPWALCSRRKRSGTACRAIELHDGKQKQSLGLCGPGLCRLPAAGAERGQHAAAITVHGVARQPKKLRRLRVAAATISSMPEPPRRVLRRPRAPRPQGRARRARPSMRPAQLRPATRRPALRARPGTPPAPSSPRVLCVPRGPAAPSVPAARGPRSPLASSSPRVACRLQRERAVGETRDKTKQKQKNKNKKKENRLPIFSGY